MIKRVGSFIVICVQIVNALVFVPIAQAEEPANIVIYQLQTGSAEAASHEYISVYNNTTEPVDITGWCITYAAGTYSVDPPEGSQPKTLGCVVAPQADVKLMLPAHGVLTLASEELIAALATIGTSFSPDIIFKGGIAASAGQIRILTADKQQTDLVGWGTTKMSEHTPAAAAKIGKILQRLSSSEEILQDTDDNNMDFIQAELQALPASVLYETEVVVDRCPNIEDIQAAVPEGYLQDDTGDCHWDQCQNIDELQRDIPDGYQESEPGVCTLIPLQGATLVITELLPNVTGVDTGKEFIELYNPNNQPISLKGYVLQAGPNFHKSYALPADQTISPDAYVAFSDTVTKLVLSNTSAALRLVAPNGNVVSQTDGYLSPKEDTAWALIGTQWQYTNQPTPGRANLANLEDLLDDEEVSGLAPCPTGQYRNPDTNRCRLLLSVSSVLTPCKPGQVRNPETNRCRAVLAASTDLVPCDEGEERNPETNRCRKQSSANTVQPCDAGEERNPDTNRCRKITSTASSGSIDKVKDVAGTAVGKSVKWWLAGAAIMTAFGYAAYEWRNDITNYLHRRKHHSK